MVQAGVVQVTLMGEPPLMGVAMTVYEVAPDTGVSVTSAELGLVGEAVMIAGTPSAGVEACRGADGGVVLPAESLATTWTS